MVSTTHCYLVENSNSPEIQSEKTDTANSSSDISADTIKPHQRRAINFLVNEYLLLHDYKLTSITFAEENENQVSFQDSAHRCLFTRVRVTYQLLSIGCFV